MTLIIEENGRFLTRPPKTDLVFPASISTTAMNRDLEDKVKSGWDTFLKDKDRTSNESGEVKKVYTLRSSENNEVFHRKIEDLTPSIPDDTTPEKEDLKNIVGLLMSQFSTIYLADHIVKEEEGKKDKMDRLEIDDCNMEKSCTVIDDDTIFFEMRSSPDSFCLYKTLEENQWEEQLAIKNIDVKATFRKKTDSTWKCELVNATYERYVPVIYRSK